MPWTESYRSYHKMSTLLNLTQIKDYLSVFYTTTNRGNYHLRESSRKFLKKLSISPALVGKIKPVVYSGFALSNCSTETQKKILNLGEELFLLSAKLESTTYWAPILILTVPYICLEQGKIEISNSILANQNERVCSMRPARLRLYLWYNSRTPLIAWMVHSPKALRNGFWVFDESRVARPFKYKQILFFK